MINGNAITERRGLDWVTVEAGCPVVPGSDERFAVFNRRAAARDPQKGVTSELFVISNLN